MEAKKRRFLRFHANPTLRCISDLSFSSFFHGTHLLLLFSSLASRTHTPITRGDPTCDQRGHANTSHVPAPSLCFSWWSSICVCISFCFLFKVIFYSPPFLPTCPPSVPHPLSQPSFLRLPCYIKRLASFKSRLAPSITQQCFSRRRVRFYCALGLSLSLSFMLLPQLLSAAVARDFL